MARKPKDPLLCCDCQAVPPMSSALGFRWAPKRCGECFDAFSARREANRIARARRLAAAMDAAGYPGANVDEVAAIDDRRYRLQLLQAGRPYVASANQRAWLIEHGETQDAARGVNHTVNTTIGRTMCGAIAVDPLYWSPARPDCEACAIACAIEVLAG